MEEVGLNTALKSFYGGKRIFLTGHSGFKGAWLLSWLHHLGGLVKGYALPPENDCDVFNHVNNHFPFENIFDDIRNRERLIAEINAFQPDIIFHLAAQPLVRKSYDIPAETFDVNVTGTANLLEAVKGLDKKCIVVVITTDKVYDNREADYHYKETDILGGFDPYSSSKAAAELVVNSFRNSFFHPDKISSHKKRIFSARAGNVIGGGDWSLDRVMPDIIRSLEKGEPVLLRNPGAIRPWQHVLEPLSGYLQLAMAAGDESKKLSPAFNFGPRPEDHLTVSELTQQAIDIWGQGEWKDVSAGVKPHEAGILKLDISLAQKELGWVPSLNSRSAIAWTLEWHRASESAAYQTMVRQMEAFTALPTQ